MKIKLTLLVASCMLLLIGCYTEDHRGYARGPAVVTSYAYVYYPDAEVYYEPQRRVYYWSDRGQWRSGPHAPGNIVLHSHVTVDLQSPEPYRHHDEVRAKHPPHPEQRQGDRSHQDHDQR